MTSAGRGNCNDPVIRVRDLDVSFRDSAGGAPIAVLKQVSFEVRDGEFVCIVGSSGAGKTTLLNVLAGFLAPTCGDVHIDHAPVKGPHPRRIMVFQESALFPWLTVEENVGLASRALGRRERDRRVARCIAMVGLTDFARAYPAQLSGGMKQRAELARACAADVRVLFLDEPFGALDFLTRLKVRAELLHLWQAERKTIVLVTHDIDEAIQLADRVLALSQCPGRISAEIDVCLPRPRALDTPGYFGVRSRIFSAIGVDVNSGSSRRAA